MAAAAMRILAGVILNGRPPPAAAGAGGGQAGDSSLSDQFPLVFGQCREDGEDKLAARLGGVDRGALAGEHLQPDLAGGEVIDDGYEMCQVAAETVQLPHDQGVLPGPQRLQACGKLRAVLFGAGGPVFVDSVLIDAGVDDRVALDHLRRPSVADEHLASPPVTNATDCDTTRTHCHPDADQAT